MVHVPHKLQTCVGKVISQTGDWCDRRKFCGGLCHIAKVVANSGALCTINKGPDYSGFLARMPAAC
jgi:hypothetical protein